jgi:hypothetical protein
MMLALNCPFRSPKITLAFDLLLESSKVSEICINYIKAFLATEFYRAGPLPSITFLFSYSLIIPWGRSESFK